MGKACYWMNGNPMPDGWAPCNPNADESACCFINKKDGDLCLSSGLCYAQADGSEGNMYSNGCTDKTGKADGCPQLCGPATGSAISREVLECSRGVYCCRDFGSKGDCCDDSSNHITTGIGKIILPTQTVSVGPSGSTSILVPSAPFSSATSPAVTHCPSSNTAVVGGAVGGTLGAALLASLAALALLYKRRSAGHKNASTGGNAAAYNNEGAAANEYKTPVGYTGNATELPMQPAQEQHVHELQGWEGNAQSPAPTYATRQ